MFRLRSAPSPMKTEARQGLSGIACPVSLADIALFAPSRVLLCPINTNVYRRAFVLSFPMSPAHYWLWPLGTALMLAFLPGPVPICSHYSGWASTGIISQMIVLLWFDETVLPVIGLMMTILSNSIWPQGEAGTGEGGIEEVTGSGPHIRPGAHPPNAHLSYIIKA